MGWNFASRRAGSPRMVAGLIYNLSPPPDERLGDQHRAEMGEAPSSGELATGGANSSKHLSAARLACKLALLASLGGRPNTFVPLLRRAHKLSAGSI